MEIDGARIFHSDLPVRRTSDGTPRIVEVMGATVTADKYPMALSLVSTTTGRLLVRVREPVQADSAYTLR